ncbi:cell wall-binding repeat-containing protein [Rossellomorea vietnamensis]|uniref:cell wall-binding repeat-containing protein n=1 Tax=Rossellomorea vietnamensis TaxID=218284 RepID=UPI001CCB57B2|nr:cell wall-binding repeat-containing protein [Rossellomorea vietnamensis]MCA0150322.1 cell wall-binding repeat-containing protein [Rossellomorea vietnamensis]
MRKGLFASISSVLLASSFLGSPVSAEGPVKEKMDLLAYDSEGYFVEEEPNDSFTGANDIYLEDIVRGTFSKDDVDMFKVQVERDESFEIYGGSWAEDPTILLDITLYDENKNKITPEEASADEEIGSMSSYSVTPGTYYISVRDRNNLATGEEYVFIPTQALIEAGVDRLYGADRYETALEIAYQGFEYADEIILATGTNFPDALAGAPLAYHRDAPILLTGKNTLHPTVKKAIQDLEVGKVTILGGPGVISDNVVKELRALDVTVNRISGKDRYDTAVAIAKKLPNNEAAVVVSGKNYPDALSIASVAAQYGYPILLSDKDSIPASSLAQAKTYEYNYVIGGTGVVSNSVLKKLNMPTRIAGQNRYETNANIIHEFDMSTHFVFVATGNQFADALTGSVLAAYWGEPLLLTTPDKLHSSIRDLMVGSTYTATILGGEKAVSSNVEDEIWSIIVGNE